MKAFVGCVVVGLLGNFLQIGGIRIWGDTGWPAIPGVECPWTARWSVYPLEYLSRVLLVLEDTVLSRSS